jgi:hypothetical protein
MTTNLLSFSNLQDHMTQLMGSNTKQLQADIGIRDSHFAEMQKDLKNGDMEGAKAELAAARDAQKSVAADRTVLRDLRTSIQGVRDELQQRTQYMDDMRTALANGDLAAAKLAFQAANHLATQIFADIGKIKNGDTLPRSTGPNPSPTAPAPAIDVTA